MDFSQNSLSVYETRMLEIQERQAIAAERQALAQERQAELLAESKGRSKVEGISKETLAIALCFTMDNPTKAEIAEKLGYSNHTALRRFRGFDRAWNARQAMKTLVVENPRRYRSDDGTDD